mgnify:CR=1 FL=1
MSFLEKLTKPEAYTAQFEPANLELKKPAKQLCWEFNQTQSSDTDRKGAILVSYLEPIMKWFL